MGVRTSLGCCGASGSEHSSDSLRWSGLGKARPGDLAPATGYERKTKLRAAAGADCHEMNSERFESELRKERAEHGRS